MNQHSTGRTCSPHVARGLTCERYEELVAEANGRCQICGTTRHLVIDHDHGVGDWAVRGILCSRCNAYLYWMEGEAKDAYLANPWHLAHPDHPVVPTPAAATPIALTLYSRLDDLRGQFESCSKNDRIAVRKAAEVVAVALLGENEMPSRVAQRAPFSIAHLRNVARRAGVEPARPGHKLGQQAQARREQIRSLLASAPPE